MFSILGSTSFAQTHPPGWVCPLKNQLKGNQRRGPDGSAFIPGAGASGLKNSDKSVRVRN